MYAIFFSALDNYCIDCNGNDDDFLIARTAWPPQLTREWSELVDNFLNEIRFTWKPVSWRVRRRVNFLLFRTHTILFIWFSKTIENASQRVLCHRSLQCSLVSMRRGVLVTFLTGERDVAGSFPVFTNYFCWILFPYDYNEWMWNHISFVFHMSTTMRNLNVTMDTAGFIAFCAQRVPRTPTQKSLFEPYQILTI